MKIIFPDRRTLGDGIDFTLFEQFGEVVLYDFTTKEEMKERVKDADILVLNKVPVCEETIGTAANLKLVCVTATGTDNLDKEYLEKRGIAWRNVEGYSTESVAQHTFAMLFYLMEKLGYYDTYVKSGQYVNDRSFSHFEEQFHELYGKTWGIIGLGAIGRRVAEIAKAFGARIIYYSASGQNPQEGYQQTDFDTLLASSDIISVHAPLNAYTKGLMNAEAFSKMKKSSIFLNLGRGAIVVEKDLCDALEQNQILAAGLDVLKQEPMREDSPFRTLAESRRLLITPHVAWSAIEARRRLMEKIAGQIEEFLTKQENL